MENLRKSDAVAKYMKLKEQYNGISHIRNIY